MYFVLSGAVIHGTVDFVRDWISAGTLCPCSPKTRQGQKQMRRVFAFHHCSHSQLLKEQVPATQIDVASEVSKKFFRQQERRSPRYYIHTQYSTNSSNSNREYCQTPGFQSLIVAKTEGHGLSKLDPLRTQVPSSCKHLFPFIESVLSNQGA